MSKRNSQLASTKRFGAWWAAVWRAQGGTCFYCDAPMDQLVTDTDRMATWDHVKPLSRKKGANKKQNMVLACKGCNQEKGNRRPSQDEKFRAKHIYWHASQLVARAIR